MPQFILNTEGADQSWQDLPAVVKGFIEVLFFTNQCTASVLIDFSGEKAESRYFSDLESDEPAFTKRDWDHPEIQNAITEGQSDGTIPSDAGVADLDPESLESIRCFVRDWVQANADLVYHAIYRPGYDSDRLGNDLAYTANGHGVGFSDRNELDCLHNAAGESLGDRLQAAALYKWESSAHYDSDTGKVFFE